MRALASDYRSQPKVCLTSLGRRGNRFGSCLHQLRKSTWRSSSFVELAGVEPACQELSGTTTTSVAL